ncbi:hypothetical protein KFK09_003823 [Dendrobium nobile]|uniref:DUF4283 domain-containing protein n=1 Tax=Dendrobium nobile TaxID=94219 RepID=A0A8T3C167_DENNO|nr:hypothetical protein KFK09_003823 [Dendrobium nobile]
MLCAFDNEERPDLVMSNGPWYVKRQNIGEDKWSSQFSPDSLKGLTSPIWIRLPSLPLHCWDEINVCRIASKVGKPYLIDDNMFHWGRREFSRICVHIQIEKILSLGVWVEGNSGRVYKKFEYKKIPNLCYNCGRI